ncbi:unnamed protein product [Rotaria magnacalcarata]|uniref:Uncharacterized protein n=1 Tax=Rotaria magnacalcarata TaxID=392030 RepID=A0A816ZZ80_9BILA|nr:unnamed protein product [Rotaria magnacalcarata]
MEVLFDLASVFKITDIKYDEINPKWNIYLMTTDEGQVYRAKEKGSQLALKHFQKAIDIYTKSLSREHPYIDLPLMYIGDILCDQDAYQYAQEPFSDS